MSARGTPGIVGRTPQGSPESCLSAASRWEPCDPGSRPRTNARTSVAKCSCTALCAPSVLFYVRKGVDRCFSRPEKAGSEISVYESEILRRTGRTISWKFRLCGLRYRIGLVDSDGESH